jgi:methylenetetrahydrofolate dehydrogenase (NADP+)/methenyltetrahydrofolate cyclohydrolase
MILEGPPVAKKILSEVKEGVGELGFSPGLAIIRVGENPASKTYVGTKLRRAKECGINGVEHHLPEDATREEIAVLIEELNEDESVHGMIVQLPLPKHLNPSLLLELISPKKDVDGLHPCSLGRLFEGSPGFVPATPQGVMEMLDFYKIPIAGKNAVVVGRSSMVGKPMAALLLNANATVEICHSKTDNLGGHTKRADILVVAVGKANLIAADMVKEGASVVDVGMNRDAEGKLCGDVDFENVIKNASVSPVPKGVGPLTVACLMKNVLKAAQESASD